jgi:uncharacterized protein
MIISVIIVATVLSPSFALAADAAPQDRPSFDCRKAVSPAEKTICANVELSRLDFRLSKIWKTMLNDFDLDDGQKTLIRSDQKAWLAQRNQCSDDADCIGKLYRNRLSSLNGTDPAYRFSGQYGVKNFGGLTLYPIGPRYLVAIQTAHPEDARWVCQLNGEARPKGDVLEITVEGSVFQARQQDAETLVIPNDQSTQSAASKFCGFNGTFAESYHRVNLNLQSSNPRKGQQ